MLVMLVMLLTLTGPRAHEEPAPSPAGVYECCSPTNPSYVLWVVIVREGKRGWATEWKEPTRTEVSYVGALQPPGEGEKAYAEWLHSPDGRKFGAWLCKWEPDQPDHFKVSCYFRYEDGFVSQAEYRFRKVGKLP